MCFDAQLLVCPVSKYLAVFALSLAGFGSTVVSERTWRFQFISETADWADSAGTVPQMQLHSPPSERLASAQTTLNGGPSGEGIRARAVDILKMQLWQ